MSKFKDKINHELEYMQFNKNANEIINLSCKKKKIITFPKVVAVAAAIALIFTMILITPDNATQNNKYSFSIVANAQSSSEDSAAGEKLNTESFVELKSDEPNYIFYNFNYILDENADNTDLVKKYLFHSFNKHLNIQVKGKNIDSITYKINKGSLSSYTMTSIDNTGKTLVVKNATAKTESELSMCYNEQSMTSFRFNPVESTDDFHCHSKQYFALDSGEIVDTQTHNDTNEYYLSNKTNINHYDYYFIKNNHQSDIIGYGYKEKNCLATPSEINKLKEYVINNDMIGFYNYQNQIFKRIIDDITLNVTVTMNNGETQTKTIEFLYTPDVIKELPKYNDAIEKGQTLSTGTISARIKK